MILTTEKSSIRSLLEKDSTKALLTLVPVFALLIGFLIYPVINLLYHSFTWWDGLNSQFIGLQNYVDLLKSPEFWLLIRNNFLLTLSIPILTVITLILALMIYEKTPGWRVFRIVFFFPYVFSTVATGFLFMNIFHFNGPVNRVLRFLGLEKLAIEWLAHGASAIGVVILCIIWLDFGVGTIIMLSGMSTIPKSVFESAILDGTNQIQRIRYIQIPMLAKTIEFYTVTCIIWVFKGMFGLIFALTNGGPGYQTTTVEYMIYMRAFVGSDMGSAAAIAVILLLMLIVLTRAQIYVSERSLDWI